MRHTNLLLLRLNRAVDCSNSKYLSEKALSIILFDNIVETQLHHLLTDKMFINKESNQQILYRYNNNQLKYYEDILKFAKKEQLLNADEYKILNFVHKQRNKIYHENEIKKCDIELTTILYYLFFNKKRMEWEKSAGFRVFSSNIDDEEIDFGQGLIKELFPFDHAKYFFNAWDYIVKKWAIKNNLALTCKMNILNQINSIERSIKYLSKTLEENNYLYQTSYYSFVKEKDKENCINIDFILLVHMYHRLCFENINCKKDLPDIKSFIENNKKIYPKWLNINKIKNRIEKFNTLTNEKIFESYVEIETRLFDLYHDSYDAMCYLDGYIQYLYDQSRGK